jgi:hypothetical protein
MAQTVAEVLTAGMDSVTLINAVNGGSYYVTGMTQTEINEMVQRNVDHLETILSYSSSMVGVPNIVGSSNSKKTNCTTAIATGKTYISNNS